MHPKNTHHSANNKPNPIAPAKPMASTCRLGPTPPLQLAAPDFAVPVRLYNVIVRLPPQISLALPTHASEQFEALSSVDSTLRYGAAQHSRPYSIPQYWALLLAQKVRHDDVVRLFVDSCAKVSCCDYLSCLIELGGFGRKRFVFCFFLLGEREERCGVGLFRWVCLPLSRR